MNFWDQRFSEPGFKYGTEPNAFVQQQAAHLTRGSRVLLPGDGEGRNGVWLAQQGHHVTSVDSSAVGLKKASELAAQRGVALTTALEDLALWEPEPGSFDAVMIIFTHLPESFRRDAHRRLGQGLKPGGRLVVEGFHPQQLTHSSGGPKDVTMLYSAEQLSDDFAALLAPEHVWHGEVSLSEGPGHQGLAVVTRWTGRKL
ncbi:SAM-dependent methyltransferase [Rhodoferax antarcticus]|uniref:SAM-dependent methyltransferase n=1 Tax=Rhodoferax antarcticus TaxID=81479 RepID=UPI002224671A|nr:class I SAM-dependent methyltransferase [Rhodoferax antarcticus]MCW2313213.1 SAM-dependent methyltransferase [Rhodoferax antarcticus]